MSLTSPSKGWAPENTLELPGLRSRESVTAANTAGATITSNEDTTIEDIYANAEQRRLQARANSQRHSKSSQGSSELLRELLNISHVVSDGASAMVDDSFSRCFAGVPPDHWNWNFYLFPAWVLGVLFRYLVLFPLRLVLLLASLMAVFSVFFPITFLMAPSPLKKRLELALIQLIARLFMMSWAAVIRYHGPRPVPQPGRVWVSNHTSMIDYALVCAHTPFSVIMQKHTGWVAFIQTQVLASLGCLWFNRTDLNDRSIVGKRMREHVHDPNAVPLLVFPEGTCVNNEYTVLFKRGAFDMPGVAVCPIAIKYNKIFVDAFWNSKKQTFGRYLLKLMKSWALVCDIWFLEPQTRGEKETADEFAARVQRMIAEKAKLRIVPWDGYLKYYSLGAKNPGLIEKRRQVFAEQLREHLPHGGSSGGGGLTTQVDAEPAAAAAAAGAGGKTAGKKDR